MSESPERPKGGLALRIVAQPADANIGGTIFGGWLLGHMDMAGGVTAWWRAKGRVGTVAIQSMEFHKPVHIGDLVSVHADILNVGRTSITVQVEAWAQRDLAPPPGIKVTAGIFTYVALDAKGNKRLVPAE